jgi:hypothetical protein
MPVQKRQSELAARQQKQMSSHWFIPHRKRRLSTRWRGSGRTHHSAGTKVTILQRHVLEREGPLEHVEQAPLLPGVEHSAVAVDSDGLSSLMAEPPLLKTAPDSSYVPDASHACFTQ